MRKWKDKGGKAKPGALLCKKRLVNKKWTLTSCFWKDNRLKTSWTTRVDITYHWVKITKWKRQTQIPVSVVLCPPPLAAVSPTHDVGYSDALPHDRTRQRGQTRWRPADTHTPRSLISNNHATIHTQNQNNGAVRRWKTIHYVMIQYDTTEKCLMCIEKLTKSQLNLGQRTKKIKKN